MVNAGDADKVVMIGVVRMELHVVVVAWSCVELYLLLFGHAWRGMYGDGTDVRCPVM